VEWGLLSHETNFLFGYIHKVQNNEDAAFLCEMVNNLLLGMFIGVGVFMNTKIIHDTLFTPRNLKTRRISIKLEKY
jgi:hypothetical protein